MNLLLKIALYGPSLVRFARDMFTSNPNMSDEEIVERWLETKQKVLAADQKWQDAGR